MVPQLKHHERLRKSLHIGIGSHKTWITKIVENPYLQFWTGVILLISVLTDVLHLHFGLVIVSVANILSAVPPMMAALERILKSHRLEDPPPTEED